MLIVPTEEARPGMALAAHVFHPDAPAQELLKAGCVLDAAMIRRLADMRVDCLFVAYPGLEDLDRHMAGILSPARQRIYRQIRAAIQSIEHADAPAMPYPDYYQATRDWVTALMEQGQHGIFLDQISGALGHSAVAHATAVAHLSLMLGLRLEGYLIKQRSRLSVHHARDVVNLGIAGMLHDVGLAKLPAEARNYSRVDPPPDQWLRSWRTHPEIGFDIVRGGVDASAAVAVRNHHQHFDGSGFPSAASPSAALARDAGERIHVFARIVAAADLFDRLRHSGPHRRRTSVEALHILRTLHHHWIDPVILAVLPSVAPPFPPGTRIELNDGSAAIVIGLNHNLPYQPIVRRTLPEGALSEPAIDLSRAGGLSIRRVGNLDVSNLIVSDSAPRRNCA